MMTPTTKPKIVLIDDDQFIAEMYVLKFKESGFEIETAEDAKTGLKKIKEFAPDVVLLDIVMPTMDGLEALREIKKSGDQKPKVILLTNLGQQEDVEKGMSLGADGYIIKADFTPSEVMEKVKSLLEK